MIRLLGRRKKLILQVLIAIPVLYIIIVGLFVNVHIQGKAVLPTVFGAINIPNVTANVTLASQNRNVTRFQDIRTSTEAINAFIVNKNQDLELKHNSAVHNESGLMNFKYHGIDLMKLPPFNFDPAYKNPCWKEDGVLRCLPYFYLAGVKKSGTTDLWGHITEHPDVVTVGKELQWFARGRFRRRHDRIDEYINRFKGAAVKIENAISTNTTYTHTLITGEASPSNLHLNSHWRYLPGNEQLEEPKYVILDYIQHILPKAKIILIFRDPIERLYSDYYHEYGRLRNTLEPSPKHFHEVVVTGLHLYEECLQTRTLRSCVYDERIYDVVKVQMQLGIYHVYWRELSRLFPRDQLLILHNSELHNVTSIMMKICDFLELRPPTRYRLHHYYTRRKVDASKGDMLNETRKLLEDFYRPHNAEMYKLTDDKTFLYKY